MSRSSLTTLLVLALSLLCCVAGSSPAAAEVEAEASPVAWRLEQPLAPPTPVGAKSSSTCGEARAEPCVPIPLGRVGDVEFEAPNRGVLITQGNGSTISPGLWAYNGHEWHQLSIVCGATEGHIAWAGAEEFWTISDGRPGQAANPTTGQPAPLADRTLCHFAHGEVVGSYASPAFQESSYQPMHALGCITVSDCWFAGDPLPGNKDGEAFHLQWNGSSLAAEPTPWGHPVEDMRLFEGRLYESVRLSTNDVVAEPEVPFPYALHAINPFGAPPVELLAGVPLYGEEGEFTQALDYLHLGADSEALWAAAGPSSEPPPESTPAPFTVARYSGGQWSQLFGAESGSTSALGEDDVVNSIAPEPGTGGAWLALDTKDDVRSPSPEASAVVAHIASDGTIETQTLPSPTEVADGVAPKGAAQNIACPAANDCWMTTTQGWIYHLAPEDERQLALDGSAAFSKLITFRPEDQGLPQVTADAPPPDDSGELSASASKPKLIVIPEVPEAKVHEALLSNIHSRLVKGTTLELRFHLAVKARVQLIARRKQETVAKTAARTFASGNRKLLLALDRQKWPTALDLKTHALAQLPLISTRSPGVNTVGTDVATLPGTPSFGGSRATAKLFGDNLP
ncbi:MAG TPA: hypothetical protein VN889_03975 [Solirubrobacteraceae bacterium]|nr:hypothetical protein [Solirubrobacteraceae bacterium]